LDLRVWSVLVGAHIANTRFGDLGYHPRTIILIFEIPSCVLGQSMKSACGENSAKYIGIMLD
jgi:hypothetical protein